MKLFNLPSSLFFNVFVWYRSSAISFQIRFQVPFHTLISNPWLFVFHQIVSRWSFILLFHNYRVSGEFLTIFLRLNRTCFQSLSSFWEWFLLPPSTCSGIRNSGPYRCTTPPSHSYHSYRFDVIAAEREERRPGERVSSDSVSVIACLAVLFYSVALLFRCDLMSQWLRFPEHDVPRVHGATPGYRPVSRC